MSLAAFFDTHLPVLPVLLPAVTAMLLLLIGDARRHVEHSLRRHKRLCGAAHRARLGAAGPGAGRRGWCSQAADGALDGLPHGRLAGAVRHRAGGRPPVGADAAADRLRRAAGAGLRQRRLGRARPLLPRAVPVPADGPERRLRHRRPVQPVRVLRGAADRQLRADAARPGPRAAARRRALRGAQPRGVGAVPDRRGAAVRADRHAELGRPGAACAAGHRPGRRCCCRPRRCCCWWCSASRRRWCRCRCGCRPPTPPPARRWRRCSRS